MRGISISRLAEIPQLYHDWPSLLNNEKGSFFEFHRREGGIKDICFITQYYAVFSLV